MKLTKENVYIDLRGKSKEELTDLREFLTSNGEKVWRDLEQFLEYSKEDSEYIGFTSEHFCDLGGKNHKDKTKVTIEQLKEILQPMETKEFEKLLNYSKSVDFKISDLAVYINKEISFDCYNQLEGDEPEDKAHLFALKYKDIDLSLEQQLQKAEAEVKRLQSLIEEENKPKVGDWVINLESETCFKWVLNYSINSKIYKKITDKELINKLNELIK